MLISIAITARFLRIETLMSGCLDIKEIMHHPHPPEPSTTEPPGFSSEFPTSSVQFRTLRDLSAVDDSHFISETDFLCYMVVGLYMTWPSAVEYLCD